MTHCYLENPLQFVVGELECCTPSMQVLSEGALAGHVEPGILSARVKLHAARLALEAASQQPNPKAIENVLDAATRHLRGARPALANPSTLPPSFRN